MATTTYQQHPPIYYTVRSAVRWVFWTTFATVLLGGLMVGLDAISRINSDPKPVCDITVNRDFTWNWNSVAIPLTDCSAPEDIVVNSDGTWEWYDPYIHGDL